MALPLQLPWQTAQTKWKSQLDPLLATPILTGTLLQNITLISGVNVINTKLGVTPQGWVITDSNAAVTVYRSAPFTSLTLTLTSSGNATVSIWVF